MTPLQERAAAARTGMGVPAVALARFGCGSDEVELAVAGVHRRGHREPAATDDRWHIGSCGKSITCTLYARLVEAGRARWGASLLDLLGDVDGVDAGWAAISIDDVLVHRARLPANLPARSLTAHQSDERPLVEQRTEVVARALSAPPRRRGRYRYSNLGYIVAGAVIDRLAGETYESALSTHVFGPLGITTAGFGAPPALWGHGGRAQAAGMVVGRGHPVDPSAAGADNPPVMSSAGRLHLTITDWTRFLRTFLVDGNDLLSPETVTRLIGVAPETGHAMGWASAHRLGAASIGQQGSNANWSATALLDDRRRRASLVVANDGRTRVLMRSAHIAVELFG